MIALEKNISDYRIMGFVENNKGIPCMKIFKLLASHIDRIRLSLKSESE